MGDCSGSFLLERAQICSGQFRTMFFVEWLYEKIDGKCTRFAFFEEPLCHYVLANIYSFFQITRVLIYDLLGTQRLKRMEQNISSVGF